MKYIFIVNPTSGKNKGKLAGKAIDDYCKSKKVNYELIYTSRIGDATYIATMYSLDKNNIIYSVGGDGTLNEIVNGMALTEAKLSIIPVGSGNDFYKVFENNTCDKCDLGLVNDRYFINVASLGLDAEIALKANELKKYKLPSNLIYIASIINNYFKFNGIELSINDISKKITILTVCNGQFYGGGFRIAPNSILDDGLFDIYDVNKLNKIQIIKLISKLLKGTHINDKNVNFYKANNINVSSKYKLNCNVDGEIITGIDFNFSIEPNAINLYNKDELKIKKLLKDKKIIK